MEYSVP